MSEGRFRRIRISRVRQAALAAGVVGLAALPLGMVALEGEPEPSANGPRPQTSIVARRSVEQVELTRPGKGPAPGPRTPTDLNRAAVKRFRGLTRPQLVELVKSGGTLEQLAAVHVLWVRGDRGEVEALVSQSGSRELVAKLEALRSSTK